MTRTVLSLLAHPDDAEILCAGTLIRLHKLGWQVHIATMTPGDCGSRDLPPEEIARTRREEAGASAARIGAAYHCLESRDLLIVYDAAHIRRAVELIRETAPAVVITHSPSDYMPDHEFTSLLARAACFGAPAPNFRTESPPTPAIPHLYYCLPIGGHSIFGEPVPATTVVDISGVIDEKLSMLACHRSQRQWLKAHHGLDDYLETARAWSAELGARHGLAYAEGFRQHTGHAYPQDDLLSTLL